MYLDFEDFRPDTPRVPSAISRREGFLLALVAHLCLIIAYLLAPAAWFEQKNVIPVSQADRENVRFVEMRPMVDRTAPPKRPADQSDIDRRSATRERAPQPDNTAPLMRGASPEKTETPPEERLAGAESRTPPAATPTPPSSATPMPPSVTTKVTMEPAPQASAAASGNLGQALRNLQRYLQDQNFNNPRGGNAEQNADIQFDSKGADFGPWLRRFKAQIERNWLVPQAAMSLKGRVVIQFVVLRNGTITELRVVQPSAIDAFTTSALNSLKLSNPTAQLPPDYPDDRALFTVTFHYNEWDDR